MILEQEEAAFNITPGLANSRKNFCCNPVLKLFGFFELAAEDERVETGFVDPNWILSSSHAVCDGWGGVLTPHNFIFFENMFL